MRHKLKYRVKEFAIRKHKEVGQKYGGFDYDYHLQEVEDFGERFLHLIEEKDQELVLAGIWGHDLIEDARVTYGELKNNFGEDLAEIVYCVTDMRGRTRADRHGGDYIKELSANRLAVFVKLCDVLANFSHSLTTKSGLFDRYKNELPLLKEALYVEGEYDEMWERLEHIAGESLDKGLYRKYIITKGDGRPVDARNEYFVLKVGGHGNPERMRASQIAVLAYADAIEHYEPNLAKELRERYETSS